ncbi:MAG: TetR/AcrR family transcriptional regulator [Planctomycetota bacterium]
MRITAEKKRATRARILEVAADLLGAGTLADVTTRDVAERTGIAHGTLFNYFPTKEALALCLCGDQLERAATVADARTAATASLEEDLFAHAAEGLSRLAPYRGWAGELFGATFRPGIDGLGTGDGTPGAEASPDPYALKARQLDGVRARIARWRGPGAANDLTLHLYWSLYLGVLAWWAADDSPHQEDTLAVLDQALAMFVASLPPADASVTGFHSVESPEGSHGH